MRAILLTLFFAAAMARNVVAQPPVVPPGQANKIAQSENAKDEAATFFKNGDGPAGLAKLQASVKSSPKAPPADVQVVGSLCSIARSMGASQHAQTRNTVLLAVSEAAKAKPRLNRADAAYLDAQIGGLYELILGDGVFARQSYQASLAQDATRKDAKAGLARIDRVEALAQERIRENNELRARGK